MAPVTLRTERLVLRPWTPADADPFAVLNADSRVMEHFPRTQDRTASDTLIARIKDQFAKHGWGL